MIKFKFKLLGALMLSVAACMPVFAAEVSGDAEATLRQAMQEAVWPGEMVKAADQYEQAFPGGDWIDAARTLQRRAKASLVMLGRKDIGLYPSSVARLSATTGPGAMARQALLGDSEAARTLAHSLIQSAPSRAVGWLQWATALGNEQAAYELAVHFREQDQPVLASQYEARAVALGYQPPTVLDHIRK